MTTTNAAVFLAEVVKTSRAPMRGELTAPAGTIAGERLVRAFARVAQLRDLNTFEHIVADVPRCSRWHVERGVPAPVVRVSDDGRSVTWRGVFTPGRWATLALCEDQLTLSWDSGTQRPSAWLGHALSQAGVV